MSIAAAAVAAPEYAVAASAAAVAAARGCPPPPGDVLGIGDETPLAIFAFILGFLTLRAMRHYSVLLPRSAGHAAVAAAGHDVVAAALPAGGHAGAFCSYAAVAPAAKAPFQMAEDEQLLGRRRHTAQAMPITGEIVAAPAFAHRMSAGDAVAAH
mmetsp:Transcript_75461/g.219196  ORF Transcript_75461/g.219196 Transcript_75461/m.219196 type:complete len:155 (-) Transcript_75461:203-667(-)